MRKLATIQKIAEVLPIEGADAIEKVRIEGWWCVAKKNEFKVGDYCVYFEIDSLLPVENPVFSFLSKGSKPKMMFVDGVGYIGYRLKTIRLRGQVSQGLALPIPLLFSSLVSYRQLEFVIKPENTANKITVTPDRITFKFISEEQERLQKNTCLALAFNATLLGVDQSMRGQLFADGFFSGLEDNANVKYEVASEFTTGEDVSELLRVVKYEPPMPAELAGVAKGPFPGFLRKTDEERIQNCSHLLASRVGQMFYVTEKLDGTSTTYYKHNGEFGVCSRNWELENSEGNTLWRSARDTQLQVTLPDGFAIQGELVGENIQGNPYKLKGQHFYAFNVFNIVERVYLDFHSFIEFCENLRIETVPVVHSIYRWDETFTLKAALEFADGSSVLGDSPREGLVFRPLHETTDMMNGSLGRLSFKVISNKYLLDYEQ